MSPSYNMLIEGVPAAMMENVAKRAGMPVGPLALNDETAIDLSHKILHQTIDINAMGRRALLQILKPRSGTPYTHQAITQKDLDCLRILLYDFAVCHILGDDHCSLLLPVSGSQVYLAAQNGPRDCRQP